MTDSLNNRVQIFTDGACRGNPGPGGWGAILRYKETEKEFYGGEKQTTNNRMEMTAIIEALNKLTRPCDVEVTTDSKYVLDGITKWLPGWKAKGWRNSSNKEVKNSDLWKQLDQLNGVHNIAWKWVKGHAGHAENERADQLANSGIDSL